MKKTQSIDTYISDFPKETQKLLQQIRALIKKTAPKSEEAMKYGIPTFVLGKNLVHFAGYKNHIGFYPAPSGIAAFKKELSLYKGAKGSVQFPLDKPLPLNLIKKIVQFRVKENLEKADFLSLLVAPARRALESKKITTVQKLSQWSEQEILQLHGMGPSSIPKLKAFLKKAKLSFKNENE